MNVSFPFLGFFLFLVHFELHQNAHYTIDFLKPV